MEWKIYYENGDTFDNTMGNPEDAPSYGVAVIVQEDEDVGRLIMHLWDWFYWRDDYKQWWGADVYGLHDQLLSNKPIRAVKIGRNMHTKEFQNLMERATDDPDFLIKSGFKKGVERPHVTV